MTPFPAIIQSYTVIFAAKNKSGKKLWRSKSPKYSWLKLNQIDAYMFPTLEKQFFDPVVFNLMSQKQIGIYTKYLIWKGFRLFSTYIWMSQKGLVRLFICFQQLFCHSGKESLVKAFLKHFKTYRNQNRLNKQPTQLLKLSIRRHWRWTKWKKKIIMSSNWIWYVSKYWCFPKKRYQHVRIC